MQFLEVTPNISVNPGDKLLIRGFKQNKDELSIHTVERTRIDNNGIGLFLNDQAYFNLSLWLNDPSFIKEIYKIILTKPNSCKHSSSSSWGRLATCLDCGHEWIKDEE